jgi:hypothetical protein
LTRLRGFVGNHLSADPVVAVTRTSIVFDLGNPQIHSQGGVIATRDAS